MSLLLLRNKIDMIFDTLLLKYSTSNNNCHKGIVVELPTHTQAVPKVLATF